MTLIKSISGIRGTIGGKPQENLTPLDATQFAAAYAQWLRERHPQADKLRVVIGRDARPSGPLLQALVQNTLLAAGIDVVDLDLATTPTVEMAVARQKAQGGIILTASHNPVEWNALKLLDERGEFIDAQAGAALLKMIEAAQFSFAPVDKLGQYHRYETALEDHIEAILALPYVRAEAIRRAGFKVAVDAVHSVGGLAIPALLEALGVEVERLYCEPTGQFPHNPEPLAAHLSAIMETVPQKGCDLGVVVDPDVDRLALITEQGAMFGEEYTLVAAADYLLKQQKGPLVSNLSSSRALRDLAGQRGVPYHASAVGEVNVVVRMKEVDALIGGEGNGGVILPDLHYGRDALVGIALVLSHLAEGRQKLSALKAQYPAYYMAKNKAQLTPGLDVEALLARVAQENSEADINTEDGVKIDYADSWVHLRKSNTEPIIRIYTEARTAAEAERLASQFTRQLEAAAR